MNADSRRSHSRAYYVPNEGESTRVCKVAFLTIFGVSSGRLNRALKAQTITGGSPHTDLRGCHVPANKTSAEKLQFVNEHINSFPKYKSHYSRNDNPNHQYLSPSLSLSKMYLLYKDRCAETNQPHVSEWIYRRTFNHDHNLSFGR